METKIIGIILAAGRGSRMKPLTDKTPKPLAKIPNGPTLLEYNLDKILPLVDKIVIVVNYLGQQIVDFIGTSYKGKSVEYVWAESPTTGTLDAFRQGIYSQKDSDINGYIVTNADTLCGDGYYESLHKKIMQNNAKCYLMATSISDRDILKTIGVFEIDKNNNLLRIVEKSPIFISNLANVGIYYFPKNVKSLISPKRQTVDKEELITDLFQDYNEFNPIQIVISMDVCESISTVQDLESIHIKNNKLQ